MQSMPTAVLSAQGKETQCLFIFFFYHWMYMHVYLSNWRKILFKRNMMQLPLVPKALPFLIHINICLTSQLPGRPSVLYLLLLIAHFSVYCSKIIKIFKALFTIGLQKGVMLQEQFLILMISL